MQLPTSVWASLSKISKDMTNPLTVWGWLSKLTPKMQIFTIVLATLFIISANTAKQSKVLRKSSKLTPNMQMLISVSVLTSAISENFKRRLQITTERLRSTTMCSTRTKISNNCWVGMSAEMRKCWENLWRFWREFWHCTRKSKGPETLQSIFRWSWRSFGSDCLSDYLSDASLMFIWWFIWWLSP